jgi:periplasmic protein CpxP/Spy
MKFSVLTLAAALFAVTAPAMAQQTPPRQDRQARAERLDPEQRIERRVQMLDKRLNLNDTQVARIRTILTQESDEMQARFQKGREGRQRAEGQGDAQRDSLRAQIKQFRDRTDTAIQEVLNADQKAQYQKLQAERGKRHERSERRGA